LSDDEARVSTRLLSHILFGPYLLNNKSKWDGDIHEAVKLWCSDPAAAEQKYGHISKWDVSRVTNVSTLFRGKQDFNKNIRTSRGTKSRGR